MKVLKKIKCALLAAKVGFNYPDLMFQHHFSIMGNMYEAILRVQEQKSPLMFQIGIVLPENEKHCIATVWVGAGADSSPVKRIEQLFEENASLKKLLSENFKNQ